MEKTITAICNAGGGALILGVEKRDDFFVVTGLRYRN
jgi:predicted HTH transcriptional regulator